MSCGFPISQALSLAHALSVRHVWTSFVVFTLYSPVWLRGGSSGGRLGRSPPLKPTKVTFFAIILYNSENNIRDIRPFLRRLFCHRSVVKYTSSLLPQRSRYETWLPNITEIAPLNSLAGPAPAWTYSNKAHSFMYCVKRSLHKRCLIRLFTQLHWPHPQSHTNNGLFKLVEHLLRVYSSFFSHSFFSWN